MESTKELAGVLGSCSGREKPRRARQLRRCLGEMGISCCFSADPNGGIYTPYGNPQRAKQGIGLALAEGRSRAGRTSYGVALGKWGSRVVSQRSQRRDLHALWNPQTKQGYWVSVAEGRSSRAHQLRRCLGERISCCFSADPNGGIYTRLWNPQTKQGIGFV